MKKIILATVAFSMIATPAAFAQHYGGPQPKHSQQWNGHGPHVQKHHGPQRRYEQPRRWSKGQRLDRDHRRNVVHARDYRRHRLYEPPRGHQWVRVGDDFVLVAITSGIIGAIIGSAIAR